MLKRKRTGLNDAMSVVTRFVNACNRHDADGVYACLHPEFDSIQPMYPSRNFRGADQVRRNWQAIFDAEPGFRLTVLRSAAVDDTVWLELHGAGRDAEVAGVFVMGIQGDRIRWARIYSALVEPVVAPVDEGAAAAPRQDVPRQAQRQSSGNGEVVEEALIAPVVDIERSGRRRRRSRRGAEEGQQAPVGETAAPAAAAEPVAAEPEPETPPAVALDAEPEAVVVAVETGDGEQDAPAEQVVVVEEVMAVADEPVVVMEAPASKSEPDEPTEAVGIVFEDEPEAKTDAAAPEPDAAAPEIPPEPEADPTPPPDDPPRRFFGKKSR